MNFRTGAKCVMVAAGLLLAGVGGARADVYEYTYTGAPFDFFVTGVQPEGFTSANSVTFSFETASPIPANSVYTITNANDWTYSNGTNFLNYQDANLQTGIVDTNYSGNVSGWNFSVGMPFSLTNPIGGGGISCGPIPCQTSVGVVTQFAGDVFGVQASGQSYSYIAGSNIPGTWSGPVDVPEPSSIALLGTGLFGLLAIRRRWFPTRRRNAA